MAAWLLPALLTAGSLGSSLWASSRRSAEFRRMMRLIEWAQNPANILRETQGLYSGMLQSPMYTAAQQGVASGARQAQSALAGKMVGSGVTGGLNAMSQAMGQALPGIQMSQMRGNMFNTAMQNAISNINQRIAASTGTMMQPSSTENIMGALLASMGPLLRDYLTRNRIATPGARMSMGPDQFYGMMQDASWGLGNL